MRRNPEEADDYYRSKILADRKVDAFLETHLDMWACMVLPGWMVGPGDVGPTSSGQVILDFLYRKLPGIPPATFSMVDARGVAEAMWLAARDLGIPFRPVEETLSDTIRWYQQNGWLKTPELK